MNIYMKEKVEIRNQEIIEMFKRETATKIIKAPTHHHIPHQSEGETASYEHMRASYHLNGSRHSSLRRNRETKDITPFKVKSWRGKPNPEGYLGERGSESASRSRSPIQRREVIGYKRKGGGYHRHAEIRKINASYTGGNVSQGITRGNTPHTTHRHKMSRKSMEMLKGGFHNFSANSKKSVFLPETLEDSLFKESHPETPPDKTPSPNKIHRMSTNINIDDLPSSKNQPLESDSLAKYSPFLGERSFLYSHPFAEKEKGLGEGKRMIKGVLKGGGGDNERYSLLVFRAPIAYSKGQICAMKIFDLSEQISAVGYTFNTLEVQEQYILFPNKSFVLNPLSVFKWIKKDDSLKGRIIRIELVSTTKSKVDPPGNKFIKYICFNPFNYENYIKAMHFIMRYLRYNNLSSELPYAFIKHKISLTKDKNIYLLEQVPHIKDQINTQIFIEFKDCILVAKSINDYQIYRGEPNAFHRVEEPPQVIIRERESIGVGVTNNTNNTNNANISININTNSDTNNININTNQRISEERSRNFRVDGSINMNMHQAMTTGEKKTQNYRRIYRGNNTTVDSNSKKVRSKSPNETRRPQIHPSNPNRESVIQASNSPTAIPPYRKQIKPKYNQFTPQKSERSCSVLNIRVKAGVNITNTTNTTNTRPISQNKFTGRTWNIPTTSSSSYKQQKEAFREYYNNRVSEGLCNGQPVFQIVSFKENRCRGDISQSVSQIDINIKGNKDEDIYEMNTGMGMGMGTGMGMGMGTGMGMRNYTNNTNNNTNTNNTNKTINNNTISPHAPPHHLDPKLPPSTKAEGEARTPVTHSGYYPVWRASYASKNTPNNLKLSTSPRDRDTRNINIRRNSSPRRFPTIHTRPTTGGKIVQHSPILDSRYHRNGNNLNSNSSTHNTQNNHNNQNNQNNPQNMRRLVFSKAGHGIRDTREDIVCPDMRIGVQKCKLYNGGSSRSGSRNSRSRGGISGVSCTNLTLDNPTPRVHDTNSITDSQLVNSYYLTRGNTHTSSIKVIVDSPILPLQGVKVPNSTHNKDIKGTLPSSHVSSRTSLLGVGDEGVKFEEYERADGDMGAGYDLKVDGAGGEHDRLIRENSSFQPELINSGDGR